MTIVSSKFNECELGNKVNCTFFLIFIDIDHSLKKLKEGAEAINDSVTERPTMQA